MIPKKRLPRHLRHTHRHRHGCGECRILWSVQAIAVLGELPRRKARRSRGERRERSCVVRMMMLLVLVMDLAFF